jgi:membrane associated rhomboid family serine protease
MILPIGDTPQPPRGYVAWVTWLLLAVNVAIYLLLTLPLGAVYPDPGDPATRELLERVARDLPAGVVYQVTAWDLVVERWGYVPGAPSGITLFTSMFLHANFAHVAGNMLFLWIYGDNVEHRLGRPLYLATYLGTGVAATLAFAAFAGRSEIPLVGASGAISGVLGCYFLFFPRNLVRLLLLLPPFLFNVVLVPAPFVLGAYVVLDNVLPLLLSAGGSVAYGAHLGGFAAGLAVAFLANRARAMPRDSRTEAHLDRADQLAARGEHASAYQHYLRALSLTDDPELRGRAHDGLRGLRLDPRLARRLGL